MNTYCDRCGKDCRLNSFSDFVAEGELTEIKSIYQTGEVKKLCAQCGSKASKFVNYYGKKKKRDLDALKSFLESGSYVFTA